MAIEHDIYIAIRNDAQHGEWIDLATTATTREACQTKATNPQIRHSREWNEANQVLAIGKFSLTLKKRLKSS